MDNIKINSLAESLIMPYAADSDPGKKRSKNEDRFGLFPHQGLFFIADGMGGMPAGETASMLILEVLPALIAQRIPEPEKMTQKALIANLKQAIIDLSDRILQNSRERSQYAGMGSTLVLALITKKNLFIAHLGDSRAYLFADNSLQRLTNDHTLVEHLLLSGEINAEEAQHHPGKNQLLQYVGMRTSPGPDVLCMPRRAGERVLLCSDGLTNMLSEAEITRFLLQNSPPDKTCKALIKAANLAGGNDNITIVLLG